MNAGEGVPARWTRTEVVRVFRERGLRPNRGLGQNFLVDANFLDAIVRSAEVGPGDQVVEIGTGIGNLTGFLAARAERVWSFEVDPALHEIASAHLRGRANVTLVRADGATFGERIDVPADTAVKVVSNLPYADYQRLLLRLLAAPRVVEAYTFMLQSDVVRKLAAGPGDAGYGPLSALVGGLLEFRSLRKVGRALFWPAPRVESELFRLRRRPGAPYPPSEIPRLDQGLRALFASRRKQLKAVTRRLGGPILERFPALAERRVESLDPATLLAMADVVRPVRTSS